MAGITHVAELRISLKQCEDVESIDGEIFREHKFKYASRCLHYFLYVFYVLVIFRHTQYWCSFIAFVWGLGGVAMVGQAWNLYSEYKEFSRFEATINKTYMFLRS